MTPKSFCKRLFALAAAAALLACPALPSRAQSAAAGTITGTVTDMSGAVVPNATVVVIDTDTGVSHTVSSNGSGTYSAPFLLPGSYEVVVTAPGMSKVDTKGLVLTVGQTLTVDAKLPVGGTSSEVTVTGEVLTLDPEKTEVAQTVDTNLVANLPVAARNWDNFVLLTPNVTQDGGSGLISFHGISGLYNENYVDGSNNNQMLFSEARGRASGAPYVYSADSIKEFQAETSNYSVEFGQAAGGQVNAITKSGTNTVHGDLFYMLRYPSLNALDPYTKFQASLQANPAIAAFELTPPIHQQQQFGGSVGGPIRKDRLFYFFTYDGFRRVGKALYTDTNSISLTPSGTYTASSTITPNQCPVVGTAGYTGTTGITPTQCTNAITFLINESTAAPTRFSKENVFFPRLDYHLNAKNDVFVDFNFADFDQSYGYSASNTFSNSSPSTNGPTSYHERFLVGGLTTQVGKASVNEVHAQWGRDLETAGDYSAGPSIGLSSLDTFGMPNALPRVAEPDEHRIQLTDVFSTTHGRHSLKFGGDANIVHEVMINLYQGGGLYSYSGSTAGTNFQSWVLDAFAGQSGDTDPFAGYHYTSFVQTIDTVNTAPGTQGKDDFWMKMWDGFGEDQWKVTPTLTVTAGVRYDLQLTPPPGKVNTNYPPISTYYNQTIKNVTDRVQPRVGFSWSPYAGTVVRGGYGLFSALNQGSTYYAMRVENGVVQVNYNYNGCGAYTTAAATTTSSCGTTVPNSSTTLAFPNVPFQPTGPALTLAQYPTGGTVPSIKGPSLAGTQSFHGLSPNFVPPFTHEMNMSVEQALPGKISLQVGYVGTRGMRLPVFVDADLIGQTPHGIRTYDVLNASNAVIETLTVPVYLPSDRAVINGVSGVPPLATFNTGFSVANTWYNSMAVTARRPFANGLEFLLNYTWAKATDDSQVGGANGTFYGGDVPLDPNNIRAENGPSDTDIRNRMTLSFVYQPKIMQDNKWVKNILDDFQFSGIEVASGGEPIYLGMSGTVYSGSTSSSSYGDDGGIYGGAISSGSGSPTTGRPPQIGRNSIYAPGFNDLDLRVSRNIPIHESIYMQVSAEAFNALNHQIITSVNATYSQYATASSSASSACSTAAGSTTESTVPSGSTLQGCISPYSGTGLSAFGVTSSTSGYTLYGARQAQFSAKLFF